MRRTAGPVEAELSRARTAIRRLSRNESSLSSSLDGLLPRIYRNATAFYR